MKINLPIDLTPKQKEVDASPARFKVVKAGRRGGKTHYKSFWLAKHALTQPGKHWYVCQNLDLIRDEMWPHLCELLGDYIQAKDDRLFRMRVSNGVFESMISCKSAERENALRGRGLRTLALDEASFVRPRLWDTVLRPMLADFQAPALISSSAKRGWFTTIYNYAKNSGDKDWAAFQFTIYDNPYIQRDEIEQIRKSTPIDVWKQEYMGEEVSHLGQVYAEFKDSSIFERDQRYQGAAAWPVVVGMDWGIMANAAAVWVHVDPEGHLVVTKEHVRNNWDVGRHSSVIRSMSSTLSNSLREYVLDRSSFRREGTSGTSIADQFRKNGIFCHRSEKDIDSSVNYVKQFMRGDGEKPWLHISTDCPMLIAAIQEWEHEEHEPDVLVALRYAVTHIVRRGLTPLANKFPDMPSRDEFDPLREIDETVARIGHKIKLPLLQKRTSWGWDGESGAPY